MKLALLIDDDPIANMINERVVKKSGAADQIAVCKSARSGLEFLTVQMQTGQPGPEIILLDINMPVMDGFGFLDELNNFPSDFAGHIKVAMLTSSLDESDKTRSSLYKNVVDFINKPLNEAKIRELTEKLATT